MFSQSIAAGGLARPLRWRWPRLSIMLLGVALAGQVRAGEAVLTFDLARRLAIAQSRQLASHDAVAAAAREMAVAAGQLPDPVLKAGVDNLPLSGADRFSLTGDFMTMRRIGLMQEWTAADKRQLRAERFALEARIAQAERAVSAAAIERATSQAWLERYYLEAMAAALAEQGEQAGREVQAVEAAYRAGRASQDEVLAARAMVAQLDDRRSELARKADNARVLLARWVGEAAAMPLGVKPAIDRLAEAQAGAQTDPGRHPELLAMAAREAAAGNEVSQAKANRRADWSVELAYQQRGPGYASMLSFGLSIPLQWNRGQRQDRELAAKLALAEQSRAEREEAERAHRADTATAYNEWQNDCERLLRYAAQIVPLARERSAAALAAYRGGKGRLAELLAARRNELDVRLQALQLEADTARLWAQLRFLVPHADESAPPAVTISEEAK